MKAALWVALLGILLCGETIASALFPEPSDEPPPENFCPTEGS